MVLRFVCLCVCACGMCVWCVSRESNGFKVCVMCVYVLYMSVVCVVYVCVECVVCGVCVWCVYRGINGLKVCVCVSVYVSVCV